MQAQKKVRDGRRIKNRNNQQKRFYSGKKKRHTVKAQLVVGKKSKKVICTSFEKGRRHDFRLFKTSKVRFHSEINVLTDTGFLGIQKLHAKSEHPKKKSKKNPLTKADKRRNRELSSIRATNEHAIAHLKRFKIISDRYRNHRKRFGLRFNLIAGIYNYELDH